MDIDALSAARSARWDRLKELSRGRGLTGAEVDEVTRLFQQTAGDLSAVQSTAPEPGLVVHLSRLLAGARVWMTGAHVMSMADVRRFFMREVPAALYRVRWWSVAIAIAVVILGTVSAVYILHTPGALDALGTPDERADFAQVRFESYYSEYDHASFTAAVWTNNAWLATQCIIFGIIAFVPVPILGLPAFMPFQLLFATAVDQLGGSAAIMSEHGMLDIFFQLIIPHGLLELSAVFVAAATGIRLAWVVLVPGHRSRARAVAEEGRTAFTVSIGLTIVLLVSGLIEGFITPSPLPWIAKDIIGVIAVAAFWVYIFVVGGAAHRAGAQGDIEGDFATAARPLAG